MSLRDLLAEKKTSVIKKWFDLIIDNFPSDSSNFLKNQKDRFLNPLGYTISENIQGLFDELIHDTESEKIFLYLNDIMKINAVQDFSPSKAVSIIYLLKQVIKDELDDMEKNKFSEDLKFLETKIDNLTFLSFDIYMKFKERIFDLRVNEIRNMTFGLLKRANLISEIEDCESDIKVETVLTRNIKG